MPTLVLVRVLMQERNIMLNVERKQVDKIGCDWIASEKMFVIAAHNGAPPVRLNPEELVDLGIELVALGTRKIFDLLILH